MSQSPERLSNNPRIPTVLVVGSPRGPAAALHTALVDDAAIHTAGPVTSLDTGAALARKTNTAVVVVVAEHDSAKLWRTLMAISRPPDPIPVVLVAPREMQTTAFLTGAEDWLQLDEDILQAPHHLVRAIENAVIRRRVASGLPTHGHLHGLVSGVAHEVNNPLTVIHANLEEACETLSDLTETVSDPDLKEELDSVNEILKEDQQAAYRIGALSRGLQNLARLANTVPAALHTGPAIRRVLLRFQKRHPGAPTPQVVGRTDWRVHASVHGFEESLFHVLENAQTANDASGHTDPVEVTLTGNCDEVEILVRDRGPGLRADLKARALAPFVTSRLPGDGLGLGLTLTALALRRAGGDITLTDRAGGGTEVRLSLLPARADIPMLLEDDDTEDIAAR